jgi:hypothetical protein
MLGIEGPPPVDLTDGFIRVNFSARGRGGSTSVKFTRLHYSLLQENISNYFSSCR